MPREHGVTASTTVSKTVSSGSNPDALAIDADELKVWCEERPKGGQFVGAGPHGVWVEHLTSGLRAFCSTERSQHRNRQIAMDMLMGGLTSPHFRG